MLRAIMALRRYADPDPVEQQDWFGTGFATEAECKDARKAWQFAQELRGVDDKLWTSRKSFVCKKTSAK